MTPITWYLYGRSGGAKKAVEEIGVKESVSGDIAVISDGANDVAVKSLVAEITPVQSGSGDPSPSNIRPISGWTGMTVTRAGKNVLSLVESEMISSGWNRLFPISLKAGTYIISCQHQFGASAKPGCQVELMDEDNVFVKYLWGTYEFGNSVFVGSPVELTEEEAKKIKFILFSLRASGVTYNDIVSGSIQLELGTSATAYEPYRGATYPVSWQTEAGTVYGGTLDTISGVLTVTDAQIASYAGETLPGEWISDRDVYAAGTTPTTGAQVVYKLATPQTYQLTPTKVRTLLGGNTIYTDAGAVSVEYVADTKLYIDNKVAELQALILEN